MHGPGLAVSWFPSMLVITKKLQSIATKGARRERVCGIGRSQPRDSQ